MVDSSGNTTIRVTKEREKLLSKMRQYFGTGKNSEAITLAMKLTDNFFQYSDNLRGIDIREIMPGDKTIRGTGYSRKNSGDDE